MFLLAQLSKEVLRTQLGNGAILMLLGMAIVFVFLTILVFTTKAVSKIVGKIDAKQPKVAVSAPEAVVPAASSDAEVAAVIAAAYVKSRN